MAEKSSSRAELGLIILLDSHMRHKHTVIAVVVGIPMFALLLPLLIGIWLPDVFFGGTRTLAAASLTNGYTFQVVQYWNHGDFYSTELHVTPPGRPPEIHTLDGDDSKSWRVPLVVNEPSRIATVTLGGGRTRNVDW